jgi:hypothetical protein
MEYRLGSFVCEIETGVCGSSWPAVGSCFLAGTDDSPNMTAAHRINSQVKSEIHTIRDERNGIERGLL